MGDQTSTSSFSGQPTRGRLRIGHSQAYTAFLCFARRRLKPGVCQGPSPHLAAFGAHPLDETLDGFVKGMLSELFRFQERQRLREPLKAKARRRLVFGLREVLRGVQAGRVKLLIVAPNVGESARLPPTPSPLLPGGAEVELSPTGAPPSKGENGPSGAPPSTPSKAGELAPVDEKVAEIILSAKEMGIPTAFALSKRRLGKALSKSIKVSAVGVYSFDGAHEQAKAALKRLQLLREGGER